MMQGVLPRSSCTRSVHSRMRIQIGCGASCASTLLPLHRARTTIEPSAAGEPRKFEQECAGSDRREVEFEAASYQTPATRRAGRNFAVEDRGHDITVEILRWVNVCSLHLRLACCQSV